MDSKALHSTFTDFKQHKSAPSPNARFVIYQSLKTHYPNHHVVSVNPTNAEFLEYADAGHATATLDTADDHLERCRKYVAPSHGRVDKDGVASLSDDVYFGMWEYEWQRLKFTLYRASWAENSWGSDTFWWYVLYPRNAPQKAESAETTGVAAAAAAKELDVVVSEDGNCPDIDRLLLALGRWTSIPHNDIYVFDEGYWRRSKSTWASIKGASWDDVILDPTIKSNLMADAQGFFSTETKELFQSLHVAYKRGIILHGLPGNGKTISIRALVSHLMTLADPIPALYVKTVADKCDGEFKSIKTIFSYARRSAPCLLIFEDLDSLVTDKVRSYFLNEVDGLESNDGILMIGSTNHLDKLDSAITKRPSRFDRKYAFRLPEFAQREAYAEYWRRKLQANKDVDFPKQISPLVAKLTKGFSFAYLKELFVVTLLTIMRGGTGEENEWDVVNPGSASVSTKETASDDETDKKAEDAKAGTEEKNDKEESKGGEKAESESATAGGKKKRELPSISVPEDLRDNLLLKVLQQQVIMLLRDMDDTDDAGKEKEKEKRDEKKKEDEKAEDSGVKDTESCKTCGTCKTCGK